MENLVFEKKPSDGKPGFLKKTSNGKSVFWIYIFCHKFSVSNPFTFTTQCHIPLECQTMNSVRLNDPSLKYQRFAPSGCKDMKIRKLEFVTKIQVLCVTLKANSESSKKKNDKINGNKEWVAKSVKRSKI